jgi:hypothetical protein
MLPENVRYSWANAILRRRKSFSGKSFSFGKIALFARFGLSGDAFGLQKSIGKLPAGFGQQAMNVLAFRPTFQNSLSLQGGNILAE